MGDALDTLTLGDDDALTMAEWVDQPEAGAQPCWIWTAEFADDGTAVVTPLDEEGIVDLQRLTFTMLVGTLADDDAVAASCGDRRCYQPAHLQVERAAPVEATRRDGFCGRGHRFTKDRHGKNRCRVCARITEAKRHGNAHLN